jgi:hypothetical protein
LSRREARRGRYTRLYQRHPPNATTPSGSSTCRGGMLQASDLNWGPPCQGHLLEQGASKHELQGQRAVSVPPIEARTHLTDPTRHCRSFQVAVGAGAHLPGPLQVNEGIVRDQLQLCCGRICMHGWTQQEHIEKIQWATVRTP